MTVGLGRKYIHKSDLFKFHIMLMLCAGDIVGLSLTADSNSADNIASGIISHVTQVSISVAFDEANESLFELDDSAFYKIVKLANDVTYRRIQRYAFHMT
jgi:hypothetical protein